MKWLIVILLIFANCKSFTINHFLSYENKQTERKLFFNKYRNDYQYNFKNIIELYKSTKQKKYSNSLQSNAWNKLGPTDFTSKLIINNGHGRVNCLAFNPLDSNELWAGSAAGGLWIFNITDSTWKLHPDTDFMSIGISSIAFAPNDPNIVYLATGDARGGDLFRGYSIGILKSTNNGKNLSLLSPINKDEMVFIKKIIVNRNNSDEIFAATNRGLYLIDTKKDSSKLLIEYDYISDIAFHYLRRNIIYVSTSNKGTNFVYKSIDSGKTFERIFQIYNSNRVELETLEFYPDHLFVLADATKKDTTAQLFLSTNSGSTFKSLLDKNSSKKLVENQGSYNLTILVNPRNKNLVYVGGIPLHRSIDGGNSWEDVGSDIHVDQHDMIIDNNSVIYLANDGGVYKSYNFGNTWENISNGLNITQFYCVDSHNYHPDLIFAGSQDNGLIRFVPMNNFHVLTGDATGIQIAGEKSDKLFSVLQGGQLYYSENYGETFDGVNLTYDIPDERTWKSPLYVNSKIDTIIIGFKKLWMSNDTGKNWIEFIKFDSSYIDFITAMHYVSINEIYIAKNKDLFLWKGGKLSLVYSFKEIISSILYFKNELYLTFGNFDNELKVIKVDFNNELVNLTYNLPNVPISKIVFNSLDSSFYLATDFGVYKSNFNNQEWIGINDVIGHPIVNDIVVNSTTGKLFAATFGKGLWEIDFSNCRNNNLILNAESELYICENSFYNLTSNNINNKNLNWSDGSFGDTISVNRKQIYFAYYIDSLNCINFSNIIKLNHLPKSSVKLIGLSKNPQCYGEPVYITAIANELDSCTFYWSNGAIGDTVELFEQGDYYTVSTNKYGCIDTSEIFNIYYVENPTKPIIQYDNKRIEIKNAISDYQDFDIIWNVNGIDSIFNQREVIPIADGNFYVKFISKNYCQSQSDVLKINKNDLEFKIDVYPSIVEDILKIECFSTENKILEFRIFDEIGCELTKNLIQIDKGINKTEIDFSKYSQGFYIFEVNYGGNHKIFKIIKMKN